MPWSWENPEFPQLKLQLFPDLTAAAVSIAASNMLKEELGYTDVVEYF